MEDGVIIVIKIMILVNVYMILRLVYLNIRLTKLENLVTILIKYTTDNDDMKFIKFGKELMKDIEK
nr:hypothetical protein [Clostridia bacterium]